jgi:hypothetical protein
MIFIEKYGAMVPIDAKKIEKIWAISRRITAVEHTTNGFFEVHHVQLSLAEVASIAMLPLAEKMPVTCFDESMMKPSSIIEIFNVHPDKIGYRVRKSDDDDNSQAAIFINQFTQTLALIGQEIKSQFTES